MAQWKLSEGSGSTAYDASGHVNTSTLYNPTWWTSDYGTTAWFSGSNSFASAAETASLEMTNQLTVAFWLRPSANSNLDPRVISKLYDWDVKLNGGGHYPQLTAGGQYAILNYSLPLITWHHVDFTFSSGTVKGYVDGVQVPFLTNTFTGTETLAQWAYGLYLATDSSQANSYIGSLNDVRVYNRAPQRPQAGIKRRSRWRQEEVAHSEAGRQRISLDTGPPLFGPQAATPLAL
jgi:hypothetical protein